MEDCHIRLGLLCWEHVELSGVLLTVQVTPSCKRHCNVAKDREDPDSCARIELCAASSTQNQVLRAVHPAFVFICRVAGARVIEACECGFSFILVPFRARVPRK